MRGQGQWQLGWNLSCGLKLLGVLAAVWPKEGEEGVQVSKTERPVLQPASRPVVRGLLPGPDTPELLGPSVGLPDPMVRPGQLQEVEGTVLEAPGISRSRADPGLPAHLAPSRAASASSEAGAQSRHTGLCF